MEHMKPDERTRIEMLLATGWTVPRIARELGRSPSTVRRELESHRLDSDRGLGCSNRICAHYDECSMEYPTATSSGRRRNIRDCFRFCPAFEQAVCPRLLGSPFVCNGCGKIHNCPLPKKFYVATAAQTAYEATLSTSRAGVRPDDGTVARMDAVLSPSVRNGQSIGAVVAGNAGIFGGYARSTVYGWLRDGLFAARGCDLPYAGTRRKPHGKPETKTNARCRVGRTYLEMKEWLKLHGDVVPCELDTVIGSVGGKVLFTMVFPGSGLALGFLRDAKTSQTCTRIFNMLWRLAGPDLFRALFAAILTDNGTEFSDPEMVENYRPDPEHNPTKLLPRGVRVWYADPYCSSQKPHVERFHLDLRRILQKGSSFDGLVQEQVDLAFSHLNSYARASLGGATPFDLFVGQHGEPGAALLATLGIRRIPAREVTLHPYLLGMKYQRAADRAVMRRNGVDPANRA